MSQQVGLRWPIKTSFRQYVLALPDGAAEAGRGASADDAAFWFPTLEPLDERASAEPFESPAPGEPREIIFDGEVRFGGHHGLLFVAIARPGLLITPDGTTTITIDYPWLSSEPEPRLAIGAGSIAKQSGTPTNHWTIVDIQLTDRGAELFGGVYHKGDPLDDMQIDWPEAAPIIVDGAARPRNRADAE